MAVLKIVLLVFLLAGGPGVLAVTTAPDTLVIWHAHKAAIPVLANDAGSLVTSSLAVVSGPAWGTAQALPDGRIRYTHLTALPATDQFTYQVADLLGVTSAPETVTLVFTNQGRLAAPTVAMPPVAPTRVVDAFPGLTFSAPTSMDGVPGETNLLFVAEKAGRIHAITNLADAASGHMLFLDLSARVTNDSSELGLKGMAFHPGFASNGLFFVTYCHTQDTVRLSRFQVPPGSPLQPADPDSEVVLIEQPNDGEFHNVADAVFGPDGYLYVGFGDEGGNQVDGFTNSQCIDRDFWSAIIRIDVDQRPGSLPPNHHPGIAAPTNYAIPPDNPFIGATQFNGLAVDPAQVRTEFYAVGFRNPWQFSFDEQTHELWVGDVGNLLWEEVGVVTAGANAGWAFYEGQHPGPRYEERPDGFTYTAPVWEYLHDSGPYNGSAVTGGLVIRTNTYPDIYPEWLGKYLCADIISGNIWTVDRSGPTAVVERIAGEGTVVQFARDPADGTILLLDFDEGRIRRLLRHEQGGDAPLPQTLSETGLFADLADLSPNPGVIPYEVNLTFWSDYAIKQRWFALPGLAGALGYAGESSWAAPTGTIWVKHFDFDLDRGNPGTRTRLETRVLVRTADGSYGVSYRWNEDATEATLVADEGQTIQLAITNAGQPALQRWRIPSRSECLLCHNPEAGHALSFNTRQLNRDGALAGGSGNFIGQLAAAGYFDVDPGDPNLMPRHVRPDETNFSREVRARSYLAVNCAYCHRGASSLQGSWDGRAQVALDACGLISQPASANGGDPNNLLVVPGSVSNSIIWNRAAGTNGFTRMPPLATSEVDPAGLQLLADWITHDLPGWQTYDDWRQARFGDTHSPDGEPEADPDGDGRVNREEFLTYSNPTNGQSYWSGEISLAGGAPTLLYELYNRSVRIEKSADLESWSAWSSAANHGLPSASGQVIRVTVPEHEEKVFYRFKIEER